MQLQKVGLRQPNHMIYTACAEQDMMICRRQAPRSESRRGCEALALLIAARSRRLVSLSGFQARCRRQPFCFFTESTFTPSLLDHNPEDLFLPCIYLACKASPATRSRCLIVQEDWPCTSCSLHAC